MSRERLAWNDIYGEDSGVHAGADCDWHLARADANRSGDEYRVRACSAIS